MSDFRPVIEKWGDPMSSTLDGDRVNEVITELAESAGCENIESHDYGDKLALGIMEGSKLLDYLESGDVELMTADTGIVEYGEPDENGDEPNICEQLVRELKDAVPHLRTMLDDGDVLRFYIDY